METIGPTIAALFPPTPSAFSFRPGPPHDLLRAFWFSPAPPRARPASLTRQRRARQRRAWRPRRPAKDVVFITFSSIIYWRTCPPRPPLHFCTFCSLRSGDFSVPPTHPGVVGPRSCASTGDEHFSSQVVWTRMWTLSQNESPADNRRMFAVNVPTVLKNKMNYTVFVGPRLVTGEGRDRTRAE